MDNVSLFGVSFNNLDMEKTIQEIDLIIQNSNKKYLVTPNVDHIVKLKSDKLFKKIYDNASLILADGMPIIISSKLLRKKLIERVTGADLVPQIMKLAEQKRYKVFILGAKKEVAQRAKDKVLYNCKTPFLIESYSPPFGFEKNNTENLKAIRKIKNFGPDILLVSLGSPKGEKFIYQNLEILNVPISMSIGAAIDFLAGKKNELLKLCRYYH
ncbi:acetyl-mannosamine transferase [Sporolactobacillus inulinus]|nr:WecB/TagA/CpsF family glycosyltransferase [Sporolactobacillus inulinus]GEB77846.1 acetyl-mannosamine transferase [Sporolactobacillus inulinus]